MIKWLEKMLDRKSKNTEEWKSKNAEEWICTGNKNENKNVEEWVCTVRVLAAPGWSGKMTLGELADLCGTARNRDEKVPMKRVR